MDLATYFDSMQTTDQRDGRLFGWYYGATTNVSDPNSLGRVKARWGAQGDNDESGWLSPMWPGSIEAIPKKGEPVIVAFIDGDPARGHYLCFAKSTTKGRPTEAMLLATTFCGLYNDLAAKFNGLKGQYNQAQADIVALCTLVSSTGLPVAGGVAKAAAPLNPTSSQDIDANAGKGKAADGSTPAAIATDSTVLSGLTKVR